mgnify:CR=1 FL=1
MGGTEPTRAIPAPYTGPNNRADAPRVGNGASIPARAAPPRINNYQQPAARGGGRVPARAG